jgi:hypothetical protein
MIAVSETNDRGENRHANGCEREHDAVHVVASAPQPAFELPPARLRAHPGNEMASLQVAARFFLLSKAQSSEDDRHRSIPESTA